MAKPPGPGKCVHCLKHVAKRDWDHVFPVSWYPDSTPPNTEKWKFPSCIPCNEAYGKLESDFRDRAGLCLDQQNPGSKSIVAATMRSLNWHEGPEPGDAQRRIQRAQKIMSQILQGTQIPEDSVYPRLIPHEQVPAEERVGIPIPVDYFCRISEKIVRGIFYIEEEKFIEPPYVIDYLPPNEEFCALADANLNEFGTIYERKPGLVVQRAVTPEDGLSSLFKIVFWEQIPMYASVTRIRSV
jgi:hypothetical protein